MVTAKAADHKRGRPRRRVHRFKTTETFVLEPGAAWTLDGVTGRIVGVEHRDGVLMAQVESDGESEFVPWAQLVRRLWEAGLVTPPSEPGRSRTPRCVELNRLTPAQRREVLITYQGLCKAVHGTPDSTVHGPGVMPVQPQYDPRVWGLLDRFAALSEELKTKGITKGTSPQRLWQKWQDLVDHGLVALIPKPWLRVDDPRVGVDDATLEFIRKFVRSLRSKSTVNQDTRIRMLRVELEAAPELSVPRDNRLRLLLKYYENGSNPDDSAKTRQEQDNRPLDGYGHLQATRPGEIIQIDMTPGNSFAFDPIVGWSNYEMLSAIDVWDKEVVGFRVCPYGHSSRDLKLLMFDVMSPVIRRTGWTIDREGNWRGHPRTVVIDQKLIVHDDVEEQEDVQVVAEADDGSVVYMRPVRPTTVVIDHGRPEDSVEFLSLITDLGIDVLFARPGTPTDKPQVESWHNPLDGIQQYIPSYKGRRVADRGVRPELSATMTQPMIEQMAIEYLMLARTHSPHGGNRDELMPHIALAPTEKFERYTETGAYIEWALDPRCVFDFLNNFTSTIQDDGVRVDNFLYDAPTGLWPQHRRRRTQGGHGIEETFAYDPYDRSCIYWCDSDTGIWHRIPIAHADDAMEPFSDIKAKAALRDAMDGVREALTPQVRKRVMDDIHFRWSRHVYKKLREARLAALDQARVTTSRRDRKLWEQLVQDATPERPAYTETSPYLQQAATEYALVGDDDDDDWSEGIG